MPKRVRGARLAEIDLGNGTAEPAFAPPSESNRWSLRSFQLDVQAARRMLEQEGIGSGENRNGFGEDQGSGPGQQAPDRDRNHSVDRSGPDREHGNGREGP